MNNNSSNDANNNSNNNEYKHDIFEMMKFLYENKNGVACDERYKRENRCYYYTMTFYGIVYFCVCDFNKEENIPLHPVELSYELFENKYALYTSVDEMIEAQKNKTQQE